MVFRVLGKKIKIVTSPCGWLGTRDVSEPNDLSTCSLLLQSTNTGIMTNPTRPVCLAQSGHIESNTGKSARQGNLTRGVGDFPVLHFLPVFDFMSHFYQLFLVSCLFVNRVISPSCQSNVIIWLIVRICVFIKD